MGILVSRWLSSFGWQSRCHTPHHHCWSKCGHKNLNFNRSNLQPVPFPTGNHILNTRTYCSIIIKGRSKCSSSGHWSFSRLSLYARIAASTWKQARRSVPTAVIQSRLRWGWLAGTKLFEFLLIIRWYVWLLLVGVIIVRPALFSSNSSCGMLGVNMYLPKQFMVVSQSA